MKTIKDLTPGIRAKINRYKDKAVKDLYNGNEYNNWKKEDTVNYINYIYKLSKQEKPMVIVADDLLQYRFFYNKLFKSGKYTELCKELCKELDKELNLELQLELDSELGSEFNKELHSELDKELDSELYSGLDKELHSELDKELNLELSSQLRLELNKELRLDLDLELSSQLGNAKYHYLFLTSEYARVYLMWYKFIKDEFNLTTKKSKELDWLYENVNNANISRAFFTKKICLVLRMPQKIVRNNNFISNINGPAIIYPNQKLFYVNGLRINKSLFDKLTNQEYTFKEFVNEPNEEIKSAVLGFYQEKFGDEFMFRFLSKNLQEVDTYVDNKDNKYLEGTTKGMNIGVYTLFKGSVNNEKIAYVRCYCPSTDRMFFLGVNPNNNNAKDAIASLYSIPKLLVNEIISIQRQGEIFSTNFTKKGLSLIKVMKDRDFQNTTNITGNEYFKLINYEY